MSDIAIEIIKPDKCGGQVAGSPSYPMCVTHLPTGLVIIVPPCRSQHRQKAMAEEMIEWAKVSNHWSYLL